MGNLGLATSFFNDKNRNLTKVRYIEPNPVKSVTIFNFARTWWS